MCLREAGFLNRVIRSGPLQKSGMLSLRETMVDISLSPAVHPAHRQDPDRFLLCPQTPENGAY
jgi:hypothetical protein